MNEQVRISFQIWDNQEIERIQREREDRQSQAWIKLNNLYLEVEMGDIALSITISNTLRNLVNQAYDQFDLMRDYWLRELLLLPNWNQF